MFPNTTTALFVLRRILKYPLNHGTVNTNARSVSEQAVAYANAIGATYDNPIKSAKSNAAAFAKATNDLAAATRHIAELEKTVAASATEAQTRARAFIDRMTSAGWITTTPASTV